MGIVTISFLSFYKDYDSMSVSRRNCGGISSCAYHYAYVIPIYYYLKTMNIIGFFFLDTPGWRSNQYLGGMFKGFSPKIKGKKLRIKKNEPENAYFTVKLDKFADFHKKHRATLVGLSAVNSL